MKPVKTIEADLVKAIQTLESVRASVGAQASLVQVPGDDAIYTVPTEVAKALRDAWERSHVLEGELEHMRSILDQVNALAREEKHG